MARRAHYSRPVGSAKARSRSRLASLIEEVQDKALYDAVHQCISDEMERNAGLTFEEWRAQAARLGRRLHNLRALRQALRSGP
jgi:hypothetical protein